MRIFDVTVPISDLMPVWPGHPRVGIERISSLINGSKSNLTQLNMSNHTGTHVDAPYHFAQDGLTVDRLSLDVLMGDAFVAEVDGLESNAIEVFDLASIHFPKDTKRLLLKTTNSHFWEDRLSEFERDYIHLAPKTAEWMVKRGIQLIGVDYLSVDAFGDSEFRAHHTLLEAGIVIVEGLNLSRVPAGPCQLVCLPLKIEGGDGAPARVLVMRN